MNININKYLEKYLPFWNNISESEKLQLSDNCNVISYNSKELIHSKENECMGMMIVKSGQVRVYMLSEDGKEITLYRLYDNDVCILSASCILSAITFDVFIEAITDTEIISINSSICQQLMHNNIYFEAYVYKLASTRFSDVMWAMQQILFMRADQRLAVFLLDEIEKEGSTKIKITHEQIAKYMGSAREVVSRLLKYFTNEGIVKISRGSIEIVDKSKLQQLL